MGKISEEDSKRIEQLIISYIRQNSNKIVLAIENAIIEKITDGLPIVSDDLVMAYVENKLDDDLSKYRVVNNLKLIFTENHINQKKLASKVGISERSLSFMVQGKSKPNVETVLKICRLINRKVEDVFWLEVNDEK